MILWLGLLACSDPTPAPEPIRPVRTLEVTRTGGALEGRFSGTTTAGSEATLSFRTGGTVDRIEVKAGDVVEVDQLLATLDANDLRLQVQQAQASVAQADANAQLAKRNLERVEQLYVDDNASAADVDAARAQSKSASASLVAAVRQLDLAKRQLESAELRANRAGRIGRVIAKENENVGAGTPVLVLTPDEALQVTVMVPAAWIERLSPGLEATVRLPETDGELRATLTEVGGSSQTAGSYPATVKLDAKDDRVRPGMVAEVSLALPATGEGRIEVPLSAIASDGSDNYVWVVTPGEPATVAKKAVQTGDITADGMVVDGVEPGDLIVTAGLSQLYDGREVRLEAK